MKFLVFPAIVTAATLGAMAVPAQAITFNLSSGIAGPNGETDQGAYSEFSQDKGFVTVDFNDGTVPTEGFVKYSFVDTDRGGKSSLIADNKWAPDGSNNEVNNSQYLQVFKGQDVVIEFEETLNYFGINWGSESVGNEFHFYRGEQKVASFGIEDIDFEQIGSLSKQGTGYLDFRAEGADDVFDKIKISQTSGGGFETDNHTFKAGTGGFEATDVPEPGVVAGVLALGGWVITKRQRSESAA